MGSIFNIKTKRKPNRGLILDLTKKPRTKLIIQKNIALRKIRLNRRLP